MAVAVLEYSIPNRKNVRRLREALAEPCCGQQGFGWSCGQPESNLALALTGFPRFCQLIAYLETPKAAVTTMYCSEVRERRCKAYDAPAGSTSTTFGFPLGVTGI